MHTHTILSAIQPTGEIHLGNYLGAIQNWVQLQDNYNCFYGIVDYHAMTMPYNPKLLREGTYNAAITLLACGIKKENLFIQSLIPEHTEMAWILNCVTSYGELTRQTQFKDKMQQLDESQSNAYISAGLFTYPVLQAADILLYHPHFVPIGKDQAQHLELSRNIVNRFNTQFEVDYFVEPQTLFTEVPKVLSLADPAKKMSKSLGDKHYISLFESEENVRKKVKIAVTDSGETKAGEMSVGVQNMFVLLKKLGSQELHDELEKEFQSGSKMYGKLKSALADTLVAFTAEMRTKREEFLADKKALERDLAEASAHIRIKAQKTIKEVREIVGLAKM